MSLTDEMSQRVMDKAPQTVATTLKGTAKAFSQLFRIGQNVGGKSIRGICLVLGKGTAFTTDNVMKAVRGLAYKTTKNLEFSNQNIDMAKLQKQGSVTKIDENITEDVMKYFNKHCKKFKIKYSAMKDESDPERPNYMVFYNGKSAEIILAAMQAAYKDYMEDKTKEKEGQEQEKTGKKKKQKKNPKREKSQEKEENRESVMARLAFFRDRVSDRDEREVKEKQIKHEDLSR